MIEIFPVKKFLLLTAGTAGVFLAASHAFDALVFDRLRVTNGELWRLFTGHLVHLDALHAVLNGLGFAFAVAILSKFIKPRLLFFSIFGLAISIGLAAVVTTPAQYAGFAGSSGIIYGLAAMACVHLFRISPGIVALLAFGLLLSLVTTASGWHRPWVTETALDTHLVGVLVGAAIGFVSMACGKNDAGQTRVSTLF